MEPTMTANLTDEQKTSLQWLDDLCAPHMYLDRLGPVRDLVKQLLSARPAESWQVEIDAYKREVRELATMLCIFDDIEVVHLKTTLSPDQRVSMAAKLLGFANELLNGIDKS
ncbi:hypothetical protein AQ916_06920 [Burkholderia pseudomallei]|nr:hypothetical protein AQ916_06920 [Burkholderia pseudomallei]